HQLFGVIDHDVGAPRVAIRITETHGEVNQRRTLMGMAYRADLFHGVERLADITVGVALLERLGDRKREPYYTHMRVPHRFLRTADIGDDGEECGRACLLGWRTIQQAQYLSCITQLGDVLGRHEATEIEPIEPDIEE